MKQDIGYYQEFGNSMMLNSRNVWFNHRLTADMQLRLTPAPKCFVSPRTSYVRRRYMKLRHQEAEGGKNEAREQDDCSLWLGLQRM